MYYSLVFSSHLLSLNLMCMSPHTMMFYYKKSAFKSQKCQQFKSSILKFPRFSFNQELRSDIKICLRCIPKLDLYPSNVLSSCWQKFKNGIMHFVFFFKLLVWLELFLCVEVLKIQEYEYKFVTDDLFESNIFSIITLS